MAGHFAELKDDALFAFNRPRICGQFVYLLHQYVALAVGLKSNGGLVGSAGL
jgi:hypothetical protein